MLPSACLIRNEGDQCIQEDVIEVNLSNSREEGVTEDEEGKDKKLAAYFSGKMGSYIPQRLMHTSPNSEVTAIFSTVPERFEINSTEDGREWLQGNLSK